MPNQVTKKPIVKRAAKKEMSHTIGVIIAVASVTFLILILLAILRELRLEPIVEPTVGLIEYLSFGLAAIEVLFVVIALVFAILGFVGYGRLKIILENRAESAAEATADEIASEVAKTQCDKDIPDAFKAYIGSAEFKKLLVETIIEVQSREKIGPKRKVTKGESTDGDIPEIPESE